MTEEGLSSFASKEKLKIVCFAGAGRSGSTMLASIMGSGENAIALGELSDLIMGRRAAHENIPCSCGNMVAECEYWSDKVNIRKYFFGSEASTSFLRLRKFAKLYSGSLSDEEAVGIRSHSSRMGDLYSEISELSSAEILVDSTKHPCAPLILNHIKNCDLYVLHLVRDIDSFIRSRSTAKDYLERIPTYKAILIWVYANFTARLLKNRIEHYKLIRYEDLSESPKAVVEEIFEWLNIKGWEQVFVGSRTVEASPEHFVAGNPDKFGVDKFEIREVNDDPSFFYKLIRLCVYPLRRNLGY